MVKDIIKFSVPNIINMLISIGTVFMLTRMLSTETYGLINTFTAIVASGWAFLCVGLDSAFIRFYNDPPCDDNEIDLGMKLLTMCVVIAFVFTIVTLIIGDSLSLVMFGENNKILSVLAAIAIVGQILLRFLNISYRMRFDSRNYGIQSILITIVSRPIIIVGAFWGFSVIGLLTLNTFSILVLGIMFLYIQRKYFFSHKTKITFNGYSRVFRYAIFVAPIMVCVSLNSSVVQRIISYYLGWSAVGVYSSASYFSSIVSALQAGFATYWAAFMYANYNKQQDRIKKTNEYLLLCIIMLFAAIVLFKDVIYILIGSEYHASKSFFSLCLVYPLMLLASETTGYGININNKTHLLLITHFIALIVNIIGTWILVPHIGMVGAAVSSALSGICIYIMITFWGQINYKSISNIKITCIDIITIIAIAIVPVIFKGIIVYILVVLLTCLAMIVNRKIIKTLCLYIKDYCFSKRKNG